MGVSCTSLIFIPTHIMQRVLLSRPNAIERSRTRIRRQVIMGHPSGQSNFFLWLHISQLEHVLQYLRLALDLDEFHVRAFRGQLEL